MLGSPCRLGQWWFVERQVDFPVEVRFVHVDVLLVASDTVIDWTIIAGVQSSSVAELPSIVIVTTSCLTS